jgi:hypothetical protein
MICVVFFSRVIEEETIENKRIAYIVGAATGLIFLAAFVLIAVTLKMTPKIDEIRKFSKFPNSLHYLFNFSFLSSLFPAICFFILLTAIYNLLLI